MTPHFFKFNAFKGPLFASLLTLFPSSTAHPHGHSTPHQALDTKKTVAKKSGHHTIQVENMTKSGFIVKFNIGTVKDSPKSKIKDTGIMLNANMYHIIWGKKYQPFIFSLNILSNASLLSILLISDIFLRPPNNVFFINQRNSHAENRDYVECPETEARRAVFNHFHVFCLNHAV